MKKKLRFFNCFSKQNQKHKDCFDICTAFFLFEPIETTYPLLKALIQFMEAQSPLKPIINVFHFMLKALFILKIFKFLSRRLCHVGKLLDRNAKFNVKIL